ncbi:MAG: AmmeMemoRadiSam system protein B [Chloroflexi bacterium RBG_16_56_8]|nr:MAG: AmmeMemoRadiSam system protein B [Chloroflexi bacterium RBG_16_56_8]
MTTHTHDPRTVRVSPIAGTWYPGSKGELERTVDGLVAQAEFFATDDELVALVSPHAGYPYSGQTAAYAYRQLTGRTFDTVVLLGPSHSENLGPFAITAKKYYATPLGEIELAQDFVEGLTKEIRVTRVDRDREHSLEIQLPFLQRTLGDFKLVPIMVTLPFYILGAQVLEPCEQLATALADLARGRNVLFVASSDLSHIPDYKAVNKFDARTAELIAAFDIPGLVEYMWQDGECRACGDAPIIIALLAAQKLGATRAKVLYRTNSGDVTSIRTRGQYTVGYMAAAVYKSKT